jgi:hypothetical protein
MRLWGAEKRSEPGRARSALQQHTWRICASAARSAQRVMRQARIGSIAGQSAQPTAPPKIRGPPRAGFAATELTHAQRTSNFGNAP